jgi:hypothetical protein
MNTGLAQYLTLTEGPRESLQVEERLMRGDVVRKTPFLRATIRGRKFNGLTGALPNRVR